VAYTLSDVADRIVVGVDGSEHGAAALRWAESEARLRGGTLAAVHAWTFTPPTAIAEPGLIPVAATDLMDDLTFERQAAENALDAALEDALGGAAGDVERVLSEGSPADVLVHESANAALVVVGSRGRGGIRGALLGSVSQHVAQHSRCPVVIVRG
jgi:nucleotide-binding universal stress UspA family protein